MWSQLIDVTSCVNDWSPCNHRCCSIFSFFFFQRGSYWWSDGWKETTTDEEKLSSCARHVRYTTHGQPGIDGYLPYLLASLFLRDADWGRRRLFSRGSHTRPSHRSTRWIAFLFFLSLFSIANNNKKLVSLTLKCARRELIGMSDWLFGAPCFPGFTPLDSGLSGLFIFLFGLINTCQCCCCALAGHLDADPKGI